ncbi:hypothetical protein Pmani_038330 [Petrolisthes manimaculis]|uniref:Uncharacterized protein n=1 Tax=Petrolisthes manimaculis TaxID=1843537 RepID=A0AAE1TKC8_9EUCA|nr:hypothetical protein Pmani_038330 [Petrolisthes manimaculis]
MSGEGGRERGRRENGGGREIGGRMEKEERWWEEEERLWEGEEERWEGEERLWEGEEERWEGKRRGGKKVEEVDMWVVIKRKCWLEWKLVKVRAWEELV